MNPGDIPRRFDAARLKQSGLVRAVDYRAELPSTNLLALQRAQEPDLPIPLLILTDRQTQGRGRGANRWWSADGALTFSLVLPADVSRTPQGVRFSPMVSLFAGLAVAGALDRLAAGGCRCLLKWPNDVLLAGRKVCGILAETAAPTGRAASRLVLGIGVNLNNATSQAPDDVRRRAVSLAEVCGRHFDPTEALLQILAELDHELRTGREAPGDWLPRWQARCALRGQWITIDQPGRRIEGRCRELAEDGALVLENPAGTVRVYSGVVSRWSPQPADQVS